MSSTLPESAEPKLIDIWMCCHVGILFCIFLVHIIVNVVKEKIEHEENLVERHFDYENKNYIASNQVKDKKWAMMKNVLELVRHILDSFF